MLKIGVIGIGNAGNQIADGIKGDYPDVEAIAVNSSHTDTSSLRYIPNIIIGDEKGAGKDRAVAKEFMRKEYKYLISQSLFTDVIEQSDIIFLPAGTGGGTGSGQSPVLTDILRHKYPTKIFINVGITPALKESVAAQQNTLDYMSELVGFNATYMLYDNNTRSDLVTSSMLTSVNKAIIEDIITLRGEYQYITPYTSIDDKDSLKIVNTPGRLLVSRTEGFNEKDLDEKSIEERLLSDLSENAHAEIDRDRIIKRMGIITNLNTKINETFDNNIPKFKDMVGEPIEGFEHVSINASDEGTNRVIVILSGLSVPDDRLQKIVQRIESAKEDLTRTKSSEILQNKNTDFVNELRGTNKPETDGDDIDEDDIFNRYM
ncbi:cell division protein FtsZ [compost metagenome]